MTATTSQTSLSAGRHHHHQQQQQHQQQSRPLPSTPIVVKEEEEEEASHSQLMLKEKEQARIRKYIDRMFKDSKLPNLIDTFPRFDSKKLMKGTLLGKGSFCSVYKLPIRDLLRRCWSPIINERPTMKAVHGHAALVMHLSEISCDTAGNSQ